MANIVTVDSAPYLVDVGFGLNTPLFPVPFPSVPLNAASAPVPNPVSICQNRRLMQKPLLSTSHPLSPPAWIYSHRNGESNEFVEAYMISASEFRQQDFEVMNLTTMTSPNSFFVQAVMCVRTFLSNDPLAQINEKTPRPNENGEPILAGQVVLLKSEVKVRYVKPGKEDEFGEYQLLENLESETTRVAALRKWFNIKLSEEEQRAIIGRPTEITTPAE
ncbi:hypothetical protein jhhlp_007027 [Lomentospora prolificans]|uniref:Uncharacterized protein n=1 Tax=Lomentospora prolificans TaxID=41688 RepID=A0A2N3N1H4_9PEZI|nr:hypothetical protein jhhlp_007027 [Lomentospora prolificans]